MPFNPHCCAYCGQRVERSIEVGLKRLKPHAIFSFDKILKEQRMEFSGEVRYIGMDCGCYDKYVIKDQPKRQKFVVDTSTPLFGEDLPMTKLPKRRRDKLHAAEVSQEAYDD